MSDYLKVHEWGAPGKEILVRKKSVDVVRCSTENLGAVLEIGDKNLCVIETYDHIKEKLDKKKKSL